MELLYFFRLSLLVIAKSQAYQNENRILYLLIAVQKPRKAPCLLQIPKLGPNDKIGDDAWEELEKCSLDWGAP